VKRQISEKVFVVEEIQPGGGVMSIKMISPRFKCFLVSEDGQSDMKRELPDLFSFSLKQSVLFVNKVRQDNKVLFTIGFSEDEIDLISSDDEEIAPEGDEECDEEECDEEDEDSDASSGLNSIEDDFIEEDVGRILEDMLDDSKKHLGGTCDKEAPVFSYAGTQVVRAAHDHFTLRAAELVTNPLTALDEDRKASLEESRTNLVRNIEWDQAPFVKFEEKTLELEKLYTASHVAKHPDKPCFGYRPVKPVSDPQAPVNPAEPPAPKKQRVIKPSVLEAV
jgi:hypothetical protein